MVGLCVCHYDDGDYYCLLLCVDWDGDVEPWMGEREDVSVTLSTLFMRG